LQVLGVVRLCFIARTRIGNAELYFKRFGARLGQMLVQPDATDPNSTLNGRSSAGR
jgi:hypothetical protein